MTPETIDLLHARLREVEAEARAFGIEDGEAAARAEAVLTVLDVRGMTLADDPRWRILECTDIEHLDGWLRAVVTTRSVDDLLADGFGEPGWVRESPSRYAARTYRFRDRLLRRTDIRGRETGRHEGLLRGWIACVLLLLDVRRCSVPAEQRARIQACKDLTQLDLWLHAAVTADSVEQIFAP